MRFEQIGSRTVSESGSFPRLQATERGPHEHFVVMDGLRGIAALCVLLFHSNRDAHNLQWMANGYLGVDFFFILSGFVISYSYHDRLLAGMPLSEFLKRRFIRLYPMILVGTLAGVTMLILRHVLHLGTPLPYLDIITATLCSMALLPWLFFNQHSTEVFPVNTVLWSLFFEISTNILYALTIRKISILALITVVIASLGGIAMSGPLGGSSQYDFLAGVPRVLCGFFGGVLLYEVWNSVQFPITVSIGLVPLSILLVVIMMIPYPVAGVVFVPVWAAFMIVVLLAANAKPGPMERKASVFLGIMSYPMYLLHRPMLYALLDGSERLVGVPIKFRIFVVLAATVIICATSYGTAIIYEAPARRLLSKLMSRP